MHSKKSFFSTKPRCDAARAARQRMVGSGIMRGAMRGAAMLGALRGATGAAMQGAVRGAMRGAMRRRAQRKAQRGVRFAISRRVAVNRKRQFLTESLLLLVRAAHAAAHNDVEPLQSDACGCEVIGSSVFERINFYRRRRSILDPKPVRSCTQRRAVLLEVFRLSQEGVLKQVRSSKVVSVTPHSSQRDAARCIKRATQRKAHRRAPSGSIMTTQPMSLMYRYLDAFRARGPREVWRKSFTTVGTGHDEVFCGACLGRAAAGRAAARRRVLGALKCLAARVGGAESGTVEPSVRPPIERLDAVARDDAVPIVVRAHLRSNTEIRLPNRSRHGLAPKAGGVLHRRCFQPSPS
eukprot:7386331-Prymnesium_polylepis.1